MLGIHFPAVNKSTLHSLRREGKNEDKTSYRILFNLGPQGHWASHSRHPVDQALSSSKQDGSLRELVEYLHNEAADSLSVLILVKTKLETLTEHMLAVYRSKLTILRKKQRDNRGKRRCNLEKVVFAVMLLNTDEFQGSWESMKMNFWKITLGQNPAQDCSLCETYTPNGLMLQLWPLLEEESFVPVWWH